MFDVLIREAGARFGLGDKSQQLLQMLLAVMSDKEAGGLQGFLEKLIAAGLGPQVQSWLGGGGAAQPVTNSQVETVLGTSGGLLSLATARLEVPRDNVASAIGYLLPPVVGKLTPGGSMPAQLPAPVLALAEAGRPLLAAPVAAESAGGGVLKWLPWVVVAAAAGLGGWYFTQNRDAGAPPPAPIEQPAPAPAASEPIPAAPAMDASQALPPASAASAEATPVTTDVAPTGPAVLTLMVRDMPALKVYFDSAKTEVHEEFANRARDLVDYLKAHPDTQAVISGYNDPSGNASANAELSKSRAKAVQGALVALGVSESRTLLEKPIDATGAGSDAAARRVEVVLRK